jgi:hypothetical protein
VSGVFPQHVLARAILIVSLASLLSGAPSSGAEEASAHGERVPLVALVANPKQYDGAEVRVTALASIGQEGAALYLSESDYRHLVTEAGVWLELPSGAAVPARRLGYVSVQGRFRAGDEIRGYAGRITDIEAVVVNEPELPQE